MKKQDLPLKMCMSKPSRYWQSKRLSTSKHLKFTDCIFHFCTFRPWENIWPGFTGKALGSVGSVQYWRPFVTCLQDSNVSVCVDGA